MPMMTSKLTFHQVGPINFGFHKSNDESLNIDNYTEGLDSDDELAVSMLRLLKITNTRFEETLIAEQVTENYRNGAAILISATVHHPFNQNKTHWVRIQRDLDPIHSSKKFFYSHHELFDSLTDDGIARYQPESGTTLRFFSRS